MSSPALSSSTSPGHIVLPSRPPSLRAGSPSSLYSTSYSFYQLDGRTPSPTSTGSRSPPNAYLGTGRPSSTEPQTPLEYLQMGIQFHESNKLKESAMCFEKSAKEQGGCGVGMLMWGLALRHGWGCEKNEKNGFKWLTKAAESAVDDLEKAKKGFETKAVKEELVLAIYEVGQCFFQGWGVAKDQKMAVNYYRVAAKLGDVDAQQDLAFCLANGKGCKKDKKEAARWYRAAVAQGASDVGMAWIYKDKYKG
ncbi:HCP-like protein [Phlebopus sp. FC_14]|nr:HCP-like protein [Phlebopus sp. FC_14]